MMIHCKDCAWFAPVSDLPATGQSGGNRMNKKILAALILLSLVLMLCIRIGGTV